MPADIVFVIDEKPHTQFKREGDDLVLDCTISLGQALTGFSIPVQTLDGRSLTVDIPEIVFPGKFTAGLPTLFSSALPQGRGLLTYACSCNSLVLLALCFVLLPLSSFSVKKMTHTLGYQKVVANEGMPISKRPGQKGNLRIKFNIRFPSRLTEQQKQLIRQAGLH